MLQLLPELLRADPQYAVLLRGAPKCGVVTPSV